MFQSFGKIDDLFFADFFQIVDYPQVLGVITLFHERIQIGPQSGFRIDPRTDQSFPVIQDQRLEQFFAEFAVAHLLQFVQQQFCQLIQRLPRFRGARHQEKRIIPPVIQASRGGHDALREDQIVVHQSGGAVGEQIAQQGAEQFVAAAGFDPEPDSDRFRFRTAHLYVLIAGQFPRFRQLARRDWCRRNPGKIPVHQLDGPVEIQVARQQDRHVRRHVIFFQEGGDLGDGGIFQMFRIADERYPAVRMRRKKFRVHRFIHQPAVVVHSLVEFLVNRLEFRMEKPHDRITKPFRFQLQQFRQFLRGNVHHIDRHVRGGERIQSGPADRGDQLAVFARGGMFRSLAGKTVDFRVNLFFFLRIGSFPALFEKLFDLIEQGFFSGIIQRTDPGVAFEQHVFQIMGQTGCFRRRIGQSGADGQLERDPGLHRDPGKIDLQSVFQRIFPGIIRIVRHVLVVIPVFVRCGSGFQFRAEYRRTAKAKPQNDSFFPLHIDNSFH